MRQTMLGFVLGIVLAVLGTGVSASPAVADNAAEYIAYGTGSILATLVYAPFKAAFCVLGMVTSGLTLPFGGPRPAGEVFTAACEGTWAITPSALKGQEAVRFVGENAGEISAQGATQPASMPPDQSAPGAAYWYYCPSAKAYYPSAPSCPEEWVKVPEQP